MRSHLMFPVLVAAAVAAGVVAFLAASPSEPTRVPAKDVGFRSFDKDRVEQLAADAAAFHREQALRTRTIAQSKQVATRWLTGIAGSRTSGDAARLPRGVRLGGTSTADVRDVRGFVRWADDLPARTWKASTRAPKLSGTRQTGIVTVPGSVSVTTFQATKRTRIDTVDVVLRMRPIGATVGRGPTGWTIVGIDAGPAAGSAKTTGIRALADPVITVRDAVQVVSTRGDREDAARIADHADTALPYLRARYEGLGSAPLATIWLMPDAKTAKRVLGATAGAPPTASTTTLGWTSTTGDVVLDMSALSSVTPLQRLGTARHELAHVATLSVLDKAPRMLLEGLAVFEETQYVTAGTTLDVDLRPLQEAFEKGTLGYQGLLAGRAASFGPAVVHADLDRTSLAGYATVAYIEDAFDHRRVQSLLAQLRGGTRMDTAVKNVLRIDTVLLQYRLQRWVDAQVEPANADDDADPPASDTKP